MIRSRFPIATFRFCRTEVLSEERLPPSGRGPTGVTVTVTVTVMNSSAASGCRPPSLPPPPRRANPLGTNVCFMNVNAQALRALGYTAPAAGAAATSWPCSHAEPQVRCIGCAWRQALHRPEPCELPWSVREPWSGPYQGLNTCANGACAVHAVFGRPSALQELFRPQAREWASASL